MTPEPGRSSPVPPNRGEPVTEAGKQLLRSDFDTTGYGPSMVRDHVHRAVLAIEAEAAALERERLLEFIDKEIARLWKVSRSWGHYGPGSLGLLVDMTNVIGGWDDLRRSLSASPDDEPTP